MHRAYGKNTERRIRWQQSRETLSPSVARPLGRSEAAFSLNGHIQYRIDTGHSEP